MRQRHAWVIRGSFAETHVGEQVLSEIIAWASLQHGLCGPQKAVLVQPEFWQQHYGEAMFFRKCVVISVLTVRKRARKFPLLK